ncbi:MAG: SsrA-binding protein SmpB [bacterium]|nr:SsrA-binding protein SmpB [bacterium]
MKIYNRRIRRDYQILEKFEAGVSLLGWEVKSLKDGRASLDEAHVRIKNNQAWLFNAFIHPYQFSDVKTIDPRRTRKLLLHKKEILNLEQKVKQKKLTIVPIAWYNKGNLIKLQAVLVRSKREFEKKETIKRKDLDREIEQEMKGH